MSISSSTLESGLRKFIDKTYSGFVGFQELQGYKSYWAAAIDNYLASIQVTTPATVTPSTGLITVSGCGSSYASNFSFSTVEGQAVNDMVSGWESMVSSMVVVPGGDYLGSGSNPIQSIAPLSDYSGKSALRSTLESMFSRTNTGAEACSTIAGAIHTATVIALVTTCVYTIPSSPPTTATGPLVYG